MFFHMYILDLHEFLFTLRFMSKISLNWVGVYLKITALVAMLMLLTDMFQTASFLKPGAWGGTRAGRYTEKKYYFFH